MLFSSLIFLQIFLPVLLILYFFVFRSLAWKNHLLLFASLLFYAWGEPEKIAFLLASIIINYFLAYCFLAPEKTKKVRFTAVTVGIVLNVALLAVMKYLPSCILFFDGIFHFPFELHLWSLPLGISFYTFQIISYLLDTYRNVNAPQKDLEKMALFVSLFPQLVAGPIVKYHDIETELSSRTVTLEDIATGGKRFILGLAKKVLLANTMASAADDIFAVPFQQLDTPVAWVGAICYSLQIYFDFSGYSDMAIGLGRIFGFHFLENFNFPYCSQSVREFWRRWHISLSSWFRDYLYIPLGGNRCGQLRWAMNIMTVFLVTGIWHGAAWNFVLWGVLYGVLIVGEKTVWGKWLEKWNNRWINSVYTLLCVISAWVFFRSDTIGNAFCYLKKMFVPCCNPELHFSDFFSPLFSAVILAAVFCCAPVALMFPKAVEQWRFGKLRIWEIPVLAVLLVFSAVCLAGNIYNPFIYFRF